MFLKNKDIKVPKYIYIINSTSVIIIFSLITII